jgi:hypothetical protein
MKGKWTSEDLEEAMETIEQGTCFLLGVSRIFHMPLSFLSNHLNGCTHSKKIGPSIVLIEEGDAIVYKWTLAMGECGLSISLNQLKLKVAKMTQIKVTPW